MGYCGRRMKTAHQSSPRESRLHAWLSPAEAPRSTDLIFVLAGRVHRKEYALELFRQGLAPRILLSVGRFEIRRFSKMALPVPLDLLKVAQEVPPPQRHYFVFFEGQQVRAEHVPPGRFGTLTEIAALARWLEANPLIRSLLIVSSDSHLRRIRMCCRALFKGSEAVAFVAAPLTPPFQPILGSAAVQQGSSLGEEGVDLSSLKDDLWEMFKLAIYWVLLKFR